MKTSNVGDSGALSLLLVQDSTGIWLVMASKRVGSFLVNEIGEHENFMLIGVVGTFMCVEIFCFLHYQSYYRRADSLRPVRIVK